MSYAGLFVNLVLSYDTITVTIVNANLKVSLTSRLMLKLMVMLKYVLYLL